MQIGSESKNPVGAVSPESSTDRKAETSKDKSVGKEREERRPPPLKVLLPAERSEPAPSVAKLAMLGGIGGSTQRN